MRTNKNKRRANIHPMPKIPSVFLRRARPQVRSASVPSGTIPPLRALPRVSSLRKEIPIVKRLRAHPKRGKHAHSTLITLASSSGMKGFTIRRRTRRTIFVIGIYALLFAVFGSLGLFVFVSDNVSLRDDIDAAHMRYVQVISQNRLLRNLLDEGKLQKERFVEMEKTVSDKSTGIDSQAINLSTVGMEQRTMLLKNIPSGVPVVFLGINSPFGTRNHPIFGKSIFHEGIDLKASMGTRVYSTADGIVQLAGVQNGYGNIMVVGHAYGFTAVYAHLSHFFVRPGDFVRKGQLIALSGNSGVTNGPHLHYEVRFLGRALNPDPFIRWNLINFGYIFEREKSIKWASLLEATKWQTKIPLR